MPTQSSLVDQFPPELLTVICLHIYSSGLPPTATSLDPPLCSDHTGTPTALPSSYPCAYWSEAAVRKTLASLCQTNKAWSEAAKPWLWRKVEIRLPRSWLSIVEEVAGGDDEEASEEQAASWWAKRSGTLRPRHSRRAHSSANVPVTMTPPQIFTTKFSSDCPALTSPFPRSCSRRPLVETPVPVGSGRKASRPRAGSSCVLSASPCKTSWNGLIPAYTVSLGSRVCEVEA